MASSVKTVISDLNGVFCLKKKWLLKKRIVDITPGVGSSMRLFADDSKVYGIIYDENDEKQLQCDLNTLHKWIENWQLRSHPDKCEVLRVTVIPILELLSLSGHPI